MNNKISDEDIKRSLNSLNFDIPPDIEKRVDDLIDKEGQNQNYFRSFVNRINPFIKWVPAYLALFLLMIFGVSHLKKNPEQSNYPKEIKIEYELKDKNIKIIWIKKQNFSLRRIEK
ncbi:MAG: hypothetical protein KAR14_07895 [Candidatus Aminicenantes bacterium]|nr:hypothetical protein [Candidatus Aminicenantes bacterium]